MSSQNLKPFQNKSNRLKPYENLHNYWVVMKCFEKFKERFYFKVLTPSQTFSKQLKPSHPYENIHSFWEVLSNF
jgi:hypothetical protein